jgi:hypothetical protein
MSTSVSKTAGSIASNAETAGEMGIVSICTIIAAHSARVVEDWTGWCNGWSGITLVWPKGIHAAITARRPYRSARHAKHHARKRVST